MCLGVTLWLSILTSQLFILSFQIYRSYLYPPPGMADPPDPELKSSHLYSSRWFFPSSNFGCLIFKLLFWISSQTFSLGVISRHGNFSFPCRGLRLGPRLGWVPVESGRDRGTSSASGIGHTHGNLRTRKPRERRPAVNQGTKQYLQEDTGRQ